MKHEAEWSQLALKFGWRKKVTTILQGHDAECGLACLAMLLEYHGKQANMVELRYVSNSSARGTSLRSLAKLAESFELQTRALTVDMSELNHLRTPFIAHVNGTHYVVVEKVGRSITLIDPAVGRRTVGFESFSKTFTGVVLEAIPTTTFRADTIRTETNWFKVLGAVKGIRSSLAWILCLALALEVTVLIVPLLVQSIVDAVVANHDYGLLGVIALAYAVVLVAQVTISSFRSWAVTILAAYLSVGWSANVFRHLMKLPESYFQNRSLGDVSSRFGSIGSVQQAVSAAAVEAALDGLMAVLTLAVLFLYAQALAWFVVIGVALYVVLRVIELNIMLEANIDLINASAKQETKFIESVRMIEVLRLGNRQGEKTADFINVVNEVQRKTVSLSSIQILFSGVGVLVLGGIKLSVLYFGASAAIAGTFSVGMLVAFIAYVDQFSGRASRLIDFCVQLRLLRVHVERVRDIVATPPERYLFGTYEGPIDYYDLVLTGAWFRFGVSEPWILKNVDLVVKEGSFVAIVGPSGCGKTTLLKMLCGLIDPQDGKLQIGGVSMDAFGKHRYRELVGVVQQEDQLLSGTIAENISGFQSDARREDIEEVAAIAGIHSEIMNMPMRYHTHVGDLGALLSGGQKQRICLARALFKKPKILILDEATSHLDEGSDLTISQRIAQLNMTRIVVAHRAKTVMAADCAYRIEGCTLVPIEIV